MSDIDEIRTAHEWASREVTTDAHLATLHKHIGVLLAEVDRIAAERDEALAQAERHRTGSIYWNGRMAEENAEAARLKRALDATTRVLWMAEHYADAGGKGGPERRDFDAALATCAANGVEWKR
jgi:hypothetical protein